MEITEFVENNEVYCTKNTITFDDIKGIEEEIGLSLGYELSQYILKYGYLAYKHIELYGVNSKQKIESDMIKQTKYLHKYFPKTIDYIALGNMGDGDYILVSSDDDVFEYFSEDDQIYNLGMKLFEYIVKIFTEANV